jgi:hypothetical protein
MPTILAGENCNVEVTFSPGSVGTANDTLTVNSDDADEASVDVALSGMGVDSAPPPTFTGTEIKKLVAGDPNTFGRFGFRVAISGDTAVVGATGYQNSSFQFVGGAFVFIRDRFTADNWGQIAQLTAPGGLENEAFGSCVAIDGDTAVVGASGENSFTGSVYVFMRHQGGADNWGLVKEITASDAQASDFFGVSCAISGDIIVVGANSEDGGSGDPLTGSGAAYVFSRNQGGTDNWGEVKKLTASDAAVGDVFGDAVSISGNTVVVAAKGVDILTPSIVFSVGAAYVFDRNQGGADNWGEVKKLMASDPQGDLFFGFSVAISGDTLLVGSFLSAAYILDRNLGGTDNWGEVKKITSSDTETGDSFGRAVALDGDIAVVGAQSKKGGEFEFNVGAAYVFSRDEGGADMWGEVVKLTASDGTAQERLGYSVAVDGDTAIVGARDEDRTSLTDAGAAYIYQ